MTNDFVRIDRDHGYKTSRDYSALYDLAMKQAVICIVGYNKSRDIAATLFYQDTLQVSARGICYISAETREDFVSQCGQADLEYLEPAGQGEFSAPSLLTAFVQGAKWWEYHSRGATMWQSDQQLAHEEAEKQEKAEKLGCQILPE